MMQVNALAPLALIAAALPHLSPGAAIVNITSINARSPPAGAIAYAASKAALENLTIGCAKSLGPRGIRVNAVSPGAVERDHAPRPADLIAAFTRETALGRLALDTEVAQAVRFLLSDAAAGVTGHSLPVSGGFRL
jgi:3-oxoacyl-[acyl-carrier protein] reductase